MKTISLICKALSDQNRLRVVMALMTYDELCACQITEFLQISGATVSRHLGLLANAGIVSSRKEGRWVIFCASLLWASLAVLGCVSASGE